MGVVKNWKMIGKMIVDHDLIGITFFALSDHDLIRDHIFPSDRDLIGDHENDDRPISEFRMNVGKTFVSFRIDSVHCVKV